MIIMLIMALWCVVTNGDDRNDIVTVVVTMVMMIMSTVTVRVIMVMKIVRADIIAGMN